MPDSHSEISNATLADVQQLVELVQGAYRGDASREGWTTEADLLDGQRTDSEEIVALITGGEARILVARGATQVLGCVCVRPASTHVYVGMLAVRPRLQGRGLGRQLLARVEQVVLEEGLAPRLRMTVIAQRVELIRWYERCGYYRTGAREPFPYGEPRFGLPRRPDLFFEVLEKALEPTLPPRSP